MTTDPIITDAEKLIRDVARAKDEQFKNLVKRVRDYSVTINPDMKIDRWKNACNTILKELEAQK